MHSEWMNIIQSVPEYQRNITLLSILWVRLLTFCTAEEKKTRSPLLTFQKHAGSVHGGGVPNSPNFDHHALKQRFL